MYMYIHVIMGKKHVIYVFHYDSIIMYYTCMFTSIIVYATLIFKAQSEVGTTEPCNI